VSSVTWREDPLLGNTVDGVCPVGSPEARAAVLRVRRMLFGPDVTMERIIRRQPAPTPIFEPNLVRCACGALFRSYHGLQKRCAPCDGEITMREAQMRVQFYRDRDSA